MPKLRLLGGRVLQYGRGNKKAPTPPPPPPPPVQPPGPTPPPLNTVGLNLVVRPSFDKNNPTWRDDTVMDTEAALWCKRAIYKVDNPDSANSGNEIYTKWYALLDTNDPYDVRYAYGGVIDALYLLDMTGYQGALDFLKGCWTHIEAAQTVLWRDRVYVANDPNMDSTVPNLSANDAVDPKFGIYRGTWLKKNYHHKSQGDWRYYGTDFHPIDSSYDSVVEILVAWALHQNPSTANNAMRDAILDNWEMNWLGKWLYRNEYECGTGTARGFPSNLGKLPSGDTIPFIKGSGLHPFSRYAHMVHAVIQIYKGLPNRPSTAFWNSMKSFPSPIPNKGNVIVHHALGSTNATFLEAARTTLAGYMNTLESQLYSPCAGGTAKAGGIHVQHKSYGDQAMFAMTPLGGNCTRGSEGADWWTYAFNGCSFMASFYRLGLTWADGRPVDLAFAKLFGRLLAYNAFRVSAANLQAPVGFDTKTFRGSDPNNPIDAFTYRRIDKDVSSPITMYQYKTNAAVTLPLPGNLSYRSPPSIAQISQGMSGDGFGLSMEVGAPGSTNEDYVRRMYTVLHGGSPATPYTSCFATALLFKYWMAKVGL